MLRVRLRSPVVSPPVLALTDYELSYNIVNSICQYGMIGLILIASVIM